MEVENYFKIQTDDQVRNLLLNGFANLVSEWGCPGAGPWGNKTLMKTPWAEAAVCIQFGQPWFLICKLGQNLEVRGP